MLRPAMGVQPGHCTKTACKQCPKFILGEYQASSVPIRGQDLTSIIHDRGVREAAVCRAAELLSFGVLDE
jgi:hypothetical protein